MLSTDKFGGLMAMDDGAADEYLFEIWNTQLALLQRALRQLTSSECHVCIKLIVRGEGPDGNDGLRTVCYGPAVSADRRRNSLVLPINQGIASEAIISRSIAFSNDILVDDRYWPRHNRGEYAKVYRTLVSAPIFFNREPIGVVCADWKDENKYDHESLCNIISSFTDMIGTANYLHRIGRALKKATTGA